MSSHCPVTFVLMTTISVLLTTTQASGGDTQKSMMIDSRVRDFLIRHCESCHGQKEPEAEFRIDQLPFALNDPDTLDQWSLVLEQLESASMPPRDAPQPSPRQRDVLTDYIRRVLTQSALERRKVAGRSSLRRLNRNEYINTLRDLFGNQVKLHRELPDDGEVDGFDKAADALDVSAAHLIAYQEAAEHAVRSVLPDRYPRPMADYRSGKQVVESNRAFGDRIGKSVRFEGDDAVVYARQYSSAQLVSARTKGPGRYRVRAKFSTRNSAGKPLPIQINHAGHFTPIDPWERVIVDIPADDYLVDEREFLLETRETVRYRAMTLPAIRGVERWMEENKSEPFSGPAVVLHWIEMEGPLPPLAPPGFDLLFVDDDRRQDAVTGNRSSRNALTPKAVAERLIRNAVPILHRGRRDSDHLDAAIAVSHRLLDEGVSFREAMVAAYIHALCSVNFLYHRVTTEPNDEGFPRLDDVSLASRLSYFLWNSGPDRTLIDLAHQGKLNDEKILKRQVERMLDDPKSDRFIADFTDQWLELDKIDETIPDPKRYPEFGDFLHWSMWREPRETFRHLLKHDLPIEQLIDADWAFLNGPLARHYGIAGIEGGELRRVDLPPDSVRGGFLTQAACLKVTADGSRTSPVLRGAWVLDRILGRPPNPPPPGTPTLEPDTRGATTIREQLARHRHDQACDRCHRHIDPPGLALEEFDAIGGYRSYYRATHGTKVALENYPAIMVRQGADVELGGVTSRDEAFENVRRYKQLLAKRKPEIIRNLIRKLTLYATGTEANLFDEAEIDRISGEVVETGAGLRTMIHGVVQSKLFRLK